eukprot:IDg1846t1
MKLLFALLSALICASALAQVDLSGRWFIISSKAYGATSCSTADIYRDGIVGGTRQKYVFQINIFNSPNRRTRKLQTFTDTFEVDGRRIFSDGGGGIFLIKRQDFLY